MTLKELQEMAFWSLENLSKKPYEQLGASSFVAKALLDPTPLSKEVLEGMGFEDAGIMEGGLRLTIGRRKLTYFPFRGKWVMAVDTTVGDWITTTGDLWQLLLRLSREQQ